MFADIQSFLGVQFVEVPQDNTQETIGQIAIGMRSTLGNLGWVAQTESNLTRLGDGGDIWLKTASYGNGLADDEFLNTMLHEIGHALGLKHPEIGGVENTARYTVDTQIRNSPGQPTKLQLYDISALQYLYNAAASRNSEDTIYSYPDGNPMEAIWDTGGNDTITAAGRSASVIINLNQTAF